MDLMKLGAELFLRKLGENGAQGLSSSAVSAALGRLLAGADGKIDFAGLLTRLQGAGRQDTAGSGSNAPISAAQISSALGEERVAGFAASLGLAPETAASGLAESLPALIEKAGPDAAIAAAGKLGGMFGGLPKG